MYLLKIFFSWYTDFGKQFGDGHKTSNSFNNFSIATNDNLEEVQKCIIAQTAPHKVTELPLYNGLNISESRRLKDLTNCSVASSGDEKSKEGCSSVGELNVHEEKDVEESSQGLE